MNTRERSLRNLVESWLGSERTEDIRVTRYSRIGRKVRRHVCVEAVRESGTLTIVFFRHDDGSWCVFPPAPRTPVMGAALHTYAFLRGTPEIACRS
ncbi:hypothetical protein SAMN05192564_1011403 [Paraburkholderia sartisoli]|uniref:Uncharacterized protein n=1 Tax=Paraburkholderia sartisoli TaxID=83784 RepID=A0A1H4B0I8_9BURK|nr:hypothetical protein SAMN05192564_1011403 [Paraburkholderia sartisoli]